MTSVPNNNAFRQGFASPYVTDLRIIFQNEFMTSFDSFTTSWRENCVFSIKPAVVTTIREKLALFDESDFMNFIEWTGGYIDSYFLPFQLAVLLQVGHADDEFFDIILAVLEYLKEAFETIFGVLNVNTGTQAYRRKFGSLDPVTYLAKKSSEMMFVHYGDRIMNTICRRVRLLRKCHSYHDSMFWNSLSGSNLAKIADLLNRVPETDRYGEFVQQYECEMIEDVQEYIRKIPLMISEKGFLIKMRECVDVEETVYNTLISPDVEVYEDCNTAILDIFRGEHEKRSTASIFSDTNSTLVHPDADFSATYYRDLYALYIFRGDQASVRNLGKLSSMIQESFVKVCIAHLNRLGEAGSGPHSLESFTPALKELSKRKKLIKSRLSQIGDSDALMNALDKASSHLSLSRLLTLGYGQQMQAAEEYSVNFLCSRDVRSNDETASLALIADYFSFIAQHVRFMNGLYMKMRIMTLQRIQLPMDRLNNFINGELVKGMVSKRVECLIQDLNTSLGVGGNDATSFHDTSSGLKCDTCLVTRLRYWGPVKDVNKLLRPCPELSSMQESIEAHLEGKIDKGRRLIRMESLSRVVIRTTLYTRGREFTRLDMLQHQCTVLMFCGKKEKVRMSELVRSLSADTIKTEIERKRAREFITLLVESLMSPYPLLLKLKVESDPDDPIISVNNGFAFQEENVRLPGEHLLLNAN